MFSCCGGGKQAETNGQHHLQQDEGEPGAGAFGGRGLLEGGHGFGDETFWIPACAGMTIKKSRAQAP